MSSCAWHSAPLLSCLWTLLPFSLVHNNICATCVLICSIVILYFSRSLLPMNAFIVCVFVKFFSLTCLRCFSAVCFLAAAIVHVCSHKSHFNSFVIVLFELCSFLFPGIFFAMSFSLERLVFGLKIGMYPCVQFCVLFIGRNRIAKVWRLVFAQHQRPL